MVTRGAKTAVPRLRFPEFRATAEWEEATLSDVSEMRAGKFIAASDIAETPSSGRFPCYGGNGLRGYAKSFTHEGKYSLIGRQGALCGNVRLFAGKFHATEHALVVTPKSGIDTDWLFHALGRLELNKYSIGQAQPGLSVQILEKIWIAFPHNSREQQKIGDCLTSLDEVIAAQDRKLEALKAHKRGLMQQLFLREGETRPRLCFPEFRDAPEWVERPLGQVIEVASGQVDPTEVPYCDLPHVGGDNIESETGNLTSLKSANEDGVTSGKYFFDERDVLYSKIRPILNKVAVPNFSGICSADIYPIRPSNSDVTRQFLVYLLRSASFVEYAAKHSERGKIPKINREALAAYSAPLPQPVEQQRIADCLSSLDTLIAAETHQLAALKTHKQGLMQQLFPLGEAGP